jgi:hypothetical protein
VPDVPSKPVGLTRPAFHSAESHDGLRHLINGGTAHVGCSTLNRAMHEIGRWDGVVTSTNAHWLCTHEQAPAGLVVNTEPATCWLCIIAEGERGG